MSVRIKRLQEPHGRRRHGMAAWMGQEGLGATRTRVGRSHDTEKKWALGTVGSWSLQGDRRCLNLPQITEDSKLIRHP